MASKADQDEIAQGHCPNCGPRRFADVVGHHEHTDEDEESGVWFREQHRILRCRGCGTAYYEKTTLFSEDIEHRYHPITGEHESYIPPVVTYWPSPSRREQPVWLPDILGVDHDLYKLLSDIYGSLDADLRVPAAIALRTAFDRTSELLGVNPAKTFARKLADLESSGKISADERNTLSILTDAGSAAAHRGWRPSPKELDTMAAIIESFIHRTFILGDAAKKLQAGIPAKPKRAAKSKSQSSVP